MMKKTILFRLAAILFMGSAALPVLAQSSILDLYSPLFLAGGGSVASAGSPQADALNPAASGGVQRLTVDVSYLALTGLGSVSGLGTVVNAGVSVPTTVGVFTGSARYIDSSFPSLNVGSMGTLNLSFAKDIYPDLYVGAGAGLQVGQDWGLGLDIGLLQRIADLGILRDFRWGIALRGMGKGYVPISSVSGAGSTPPAFTPVLGTGFTILKTDPVSVSLSADLGFPSFRDVTFQAGTSISLFDAVTLAVSTSFDLADTLAGNARPLPLSLGLFGAIPLRAAGDLAVTSAASALQDGVWGFGAGGTFAYRSLDLTPPLITIEDTETLFISPNTASSQGVLTVPLHVSDDRYLLGYRLVVRDEAGGAVRAMEESYTGPPSKGLQNLIDRFLHVKKSIDIPPSLAWDGRNDEGIQVPDGAYTYTVEAWDDNNNLGRADPLVVQVDTKQPTVSLSAPYLEFSPVGEGIRGSLTIQQTGSAEDLWVGTILNSAGNEIRQFRWTNGAPATFTWMGKDTYGRVASDGLYTYRIACTDRAGNTGGAVLEGIIINTEATPVGLSTDLPAFSPNGDGVKDVIRFIPSLKVTTGIEKWALSVKDPSGTSRRVYAGATRIPETIPFDGKDNQGARLPEGTYQASLNVVYRNGHTPTADSPRFLLRVTPPSASVGAEWREFSPDGVGTKTSLPVTQTGSVEILWEGSIRNAGGTVVKSFRWDESAPASLSWDGREEDGTIAPDGEYRYLLTSTDAAGNTGGATLDGIIINTAATPASLSVDLRAFSPNGDGAKDTLAISLNAPVAKGIEKWGLVIKDAGGRARRGYSGTTRLPATQEFDGRDDKGAILPEGSYTATLSLTYGNGHVPSATSPVFAIDVTPPTAVTRSDYGVFSPVGEGTRNLLTFTQRGSKDAVWTGTVTDSTGAAVRTASWTGRPEAEFVFDGHGDDGELLPDGPYSYTLSASDGAGNEGAAAPLAFAIDTRATPVIVSTDLSSFSPNGDGARDTIRIIPALKIATGVDTFELRVKSVAGTVAWKAEGRNAAPGDVVWDGRDEARARAPDGQYTVELDVLYANGNHPVARTNAFTIDTVFPDVAASATPLLFSPTEGSTVPSVSIHQGSGEEDLWTGRIVNGEGAAVRSYSWKNRAVDFTWDGRDDNGNAAPDGVYRYVISSTDRAGNRTEKTVEGITVDTRPTPISLKALSDGLSPNGDGLRDTIGFSLSLGLPQGVSTWRLSLIEATKGVQKVFRGESAVPSALLWDGRSDAGAIVEGTYAARLDVGYAKGDAPTARSGSFLLSVTPAKVNLSAGPLPFSPDGDGYNDVLTVALGAQDPSPIESWDISVIDPEAHFFTGFSGKGAPEGAFTWDGLSANGELVQSAEDYTMKVTVRDALGNVATVNRKLPIDVLVVRDGDKLKVRVTSITFAANTADYVNVPPDRAEKNAQTLARLAQIFRKYGQYGIRIEGHAVMVYWDRPEEGKKEQEFVLIPLSKARAEAIKEALTKLGIDPRRVTTDGFGGAYPIVPFGDLENRWKDRRVEFILVRE